LPAVRGVTTATRKHEATTEVW